MKKLIVLVWTLICIFSLVGCDIGGKTVNIDFPFEVGEVENIEMYHYVGAPVSAEKKIVTAEEDIKTLYDMFEKLSLETKEIEETAGAEITSFRFNLSDGTNYELIYSGYGVKTGKLQSTTGGFDYFTIADIGWNWAFLDEGLEAVPVEESELPKYSDGTTPVSEAESKPTITNGEYVDNVSDELPDKGMPADFNEAKFEGMAITYTAAGSPIVNDPNATAENRSEKGLVIATTVKDTWCYNDEALNNETFIIPSEKAVVVLQTVKSSAQITYADHTVWADCSHLKLG